MAGIHNETLLISILPTRFGNTFKRSGINTIGELINKIQTEGLSYGTYSGYYLRETYLRQGGRKTWESALAILDDIGFNWREYVVKGHYGGDYVVESPELRISLKIEELKREIIKLNQLLEEYLESQNAHS